MNRVTRFCALGLVGLLAACDEPWIISHVDRLSHVSINDLWTAQGSDGIPVEIHGTPFKGASADRLAEVLRAPSAASGVTFISVPVGSYNRDHGWRMVMHFNPIGAPNSQVDCKRSTPAQTAPQPTEGYSVNVSFCDGSDWQAHGFMKVLSAEPGDLQTYAQRMQALFSEVFREEQNR